MFDWVLNAPLRSSQVLYKITNLENFTKILIKTLLEVCNVTSKGFHHRCCRVNFAIFFKTVFYQTLWIAQLFLHQFRISCTSLGHRIGQYIAQKVKFSIKDFFCKCDQIRKKLRIWSHLLEKSLMENFTFRAVTVSCDRYWQFIIENVVSWVIVIQISMRNFQSYVNYQVFQNHWPEPKPKLSSIYFDDTWI